MDNILVTICFKITNRLHLREITNNLTKLTTILHISKVISRVEFGEGRVYKNFIPILIEYKKHQIVAKLKDKNEETTRVIVWLTCMEGEANLLPPFHGLHKLLSKVMCSIS